MTPEDMQRQIDSARRLEAKLHGGGIAQLAAKLAEAERKLDALLNLCVVPDREDEDGVMYYAAFAGWDDNEIRHGLRPMYTSGTDPVQLKAELMSEALDALAFVAPPDAPQP